MPEYRFYQLGRSTLAQALGGILPKALERDMRAYVLCDSVERANDLNTRLWTDPAGSFLPHGMASEQGAELQPVLLGTADSKPQNDANLLILTGGLDTANDNAYELVCVMLDGNDDDALKSSRTIWKRVKDLGAKASYWIQNDAGAWQEKASG